ncbi:MAG: ABC transporter permease, partial [Acidimicrobiales bacterium]
PATVSSTGASLLLGPALPLVFASLAQMVVILVGDFDLGIGYAIGLVNVFSATALATNTWLGAVLLIAMVLAYVAMGAIVQFFQVPAIVVTLGASFIWLGIGLTVQPTPGGNVPSWLETATNATWPVIPEPVYIMVAGALVAWWLMSRWRYGIVLRGLGNNRAALENSGWSPLVTRLCAYALAGAFVDIAGLLTTSVTTSADINASATLTLITFAVVVVGGCRFQGGIVVPAGVVSAAVAFSLLASVLSFMNVTAAWNTAVEGFVLVGAVGARWLVEGIRRFMRGRAE